MGSIGLRRMLSSPVMTVYPFCTKADIAVKKRMVVPEFSILITSSGATRAVLPLTVIWSGRSTILTPKALHPLIVAIVSRDRNVLKSNDSPSASEDTAIAL
jgi:hypothetical protein